MFVLIAGGGRTGTQLAKILSSQKYDVMLVENRPDVLTHVHKEIPTECIYEGNPIDPHVLESAGARRADVIAACSAEDEENLLICYLARKRFNIPRTIARINRPRDAWLFDETFNVDVAVNQAEIMSKIIQEEMSMGDMMTVMKLRKGNFSIVEEKIPPDAVAVGRRIMDAPIPAQSVITAIIRHGEVVVPRGDTVFQAGDEVMALTDQASMPALASLFAGKPPSQRGI